MSTAYFTDNSPLALRGGEDIDQVIKEVLAITRWEGTDYLIIDTPLGLSDEMLDVIQLIRNGNVIMVYTPSRLSLHAVLRMYNILSN